MADNVYLLETRLSPAQQAALGAVRGVARQGGVTVFLVGGAVRDLMSGSPVRDLDFAVQGPAVELREGLEEAGGIFSGEDRERQAVYLRFPGGVRVEVGSTLSATYPKPGRPVYETTSILDDLRRRDFTANAMALSLNDGSYGLLMDPLNGVADIENRELRLVSNYGFIEDPVRMIRAARLMARQGWQMEERTQGRYETGKEEGYVNAMRPAERAYELEEVFHEEDPLRVMRRLEEEGWLQVLSPALSVAKANVVELGRLREAQLQFQTRGVLADVAAANFPLLTAKLTPAEVEAIRSSFPRAGFTEEIEGLEGAAKELVARVVSKEMAAPSAAYQFLMHAAPATVVYAAYSSRSAAFQAKVRSFLTDWPTAQSRIPHALMLEMRITPELPGHAELMDKVYYALMDGGLTTPEEMRAFLEPYSPPAPPPPVSLRRPRAPRKEAKGAKSKKKVALAIDGVDAAPAEAAPTEKEGAEPGTTVAAATPAEVPVKQPKPAKKPVVATEVTEGERPKPAGVEAKAKRLKEETKPVSAPEIAPPKPAGKAVDGTGAKVVAAKVVAAKSAPVKGRKDADGTRPVASTKKLVARAPEAKRPVAKAVAASKRPAGPVPVKKSSVKGGSATKGESVKRVAAPVRPTRSVGAKKAGAKASPAKKTATKSAPSRRTVAKTPARGAAKGKASARR